MCGFLIIKSQTALHHAVWCGAVQDYLRCGYAILQAVLVEFLRFMRFDEHPKRDHTKILFGGNIAFLQMYGRLAGSTNVLYNKRIHFLAGTLLEI